MEVDIKKQKRIDDLASEYSPQKVEEERETITVGINTVSQTLQRFSKLIEMVEEMKRTSNFFHYSARIKEIIDSQQEVFDEKEINHFLKFADYPQQPNEYPKYAAKFINQIIRTSYENGHNHLTLQPSYLIGLLKGFDCHSNPFNLELETENIGQHLGRKAASLNVVLKGSGRHSLFSDALNCRVQVYGNAGGCFGNGARRCHFEVHGTTGNDSANGAKGCTFILHGRVDEYFSGKSARTDFKTDNPITLVQLAEHVSKYENSWEKEKPSGNRIFFIHDNGTEEIVKDYR